MEINQQGMFPQAPVLILAASSLSKTLPLLIKQYHTQFNIFIHARYSSSGACAQLIQTKNPFDLFISANSFYVDQLSALHLIRKESQFTIGAGKVALASLTPAELNPISLHELTHSNIKKIAIPQPSVSPYGMAAQHALTQIGIWQKIEDRFIYAKDALHALNLLKAKVVDAAFTSDLLLNNQTTSYTILDDYLHPALAITSGIIRGSHHVGAAIRFLNFLKSNEVYSLLSKKSLQHPFQ